MNLDILKPGTLHVITGGMKGGKTSLLLEYFAQLRYTNKQTQIFKPTCDNRPELQGERSSNNVFYQGEFVGLV